MCNNLLSIKNPSRKFRVGYDHHIINVPCGHCKECIQQQQDDWFIRALFEHKRVKQLGGSTWFPTFTYQPEFVPIYSDSNLGFRFPCFNPVHIKSFKDKFRNYLTRYFSGVPIKIYKRDKHNNIIKNSNGKPIVQLVLKIRKPLSIDDAKNKVKGITYLICSEFGGKFGRPHYHGLINIPFSIDFKVIFFLIQKSWNFGFIRYSKDYGPQVISDAGIKYAMKYITKDMTWFDVLKASDYIGKLKADLKCCQDLVNSKNYSDLELSDVYDHIEDIKAKISDFNKCCPKHYQSTSYGICGLKYLKDSEGNYKIENLIENVIELSNLDFDFQHDSRTKYNIPRYFLKKIFYDVDKFDSSLFNMNDLGRKVVAARLQLRIKRFCEKISPYLQSDESLKAHLQPLKYSDLYIKDLYKDFINYVGDINLQDIAIYDIIYRHVVVNSFHSHVASMPKYKALHYLSCAGKWQLIHSLEKENIPPCDQFQNMCYKKEFLSQNTRNNWYDNLYFYRPIEAFLQQFRILENRLGKCYNDCSKFKDLQNRTCSHEFL